MATTRTVEAAAPFIGVEQKNPGAYQRALAAGMKHDAAILATEVPAYWSYFRIVHPMDFRVAFASKDPVNAVLTRLGYNVAGIPEPERKARDENGEDIKPKMNW